ncbi:hypothetical protein [Mycolicibacillus parakoreensis]|uniref:Uncharacterized protein n=1 Tax=Mycolicibacillus parakoreensis TaxID=1069221 RepID=A0ABY3TY24_9MYCO|nr:hypothetical protein [Mycolicibacillus parakoreensis]ULN52583.1 hypothetical protein MIU77_17380 [Mycolicibacillus parakoreensis]
MDPELVAVIEEYLRAHGMSTPAPEVMSDLVTGVGSTIDGLLATLGLAANLGDPADNAEAQLDEADREAGLVDAETKFPANEAQSAQLLQQLPQAAAGIAGAAGGIFTGFLQGMAQLPQQAAQGVSQALQGGLGALQQGVDPALDLGADVFEDDPLEEFDDFGGDDVGWGGVGPEAAGDSGVIDGTAPTGYLGPPPTPSPGTAPASAAVGPTAPAGPPPAPAGSRGAMGAVPLMPPAPMYGTGADGDTKPATKRIVGPTVTNGAPVQGRIVAPPTPAVTKRVEGKPVPTRRVVAVHPPADGDPDG